MIPAYFPITDPTLVFLVVLSVILLAPIIMGKLRIPHIIGMVLAGVVLWKYGLNILVRDNSFELFGKVGLYYIMFLASLEMEMEGVKKNKYRMLAFGLLTFAVPLVLVYFSCVYLLHFSAQASLLLGCIMSSNTLIAYPIVSRYGLQRKPSVMLSVGATMLSLLLSLVLLAGIVSSAESGSDVGFWLLLTLKFALYCAAMMMITKKDIKTDSEKKSGGWLIYAVLSAIFASLTSILGKIGIEGIDSNLGTAIRTTVVLLMAWLMVFVTQKQKEINKIEKKELCFICLSGLATGASWLFYYRALQEGPASVVVPIDKLSMLVTIAFSWIVFHEKLTKKSAVGVLLITAGTLLLAVTA